MWTYFRACFGEKIQLCFIRVVLWQCANSGRGCQRRCYRFPSLRWESGFRFWHFHIKRCRRVLAKNWRLDKHPAVWITDGKMMFCILITQFQPDLTDVGCWGETKGIGNNDSWFHHLYSDTLVEDNRWPHNTPMWRLYRSTVPLIQLQGFFSAVLIFSLSSFLCTWDVRWFLFGDQDMLTADCPVQHLTI